MSAALLVILTGRGGELGRQRLEMPPDSQPDDCSESVQEVISQWTLSVGDTIRIVEEGFE
jgi:hypothetical protein